MSAPMKIKNLDLSNVTFSDVKLDSHGRKMIYVNYNGGKILLQTPKMYVPNGMKRWRKKDAVDNKDDSFEMELSFRTSTDDENNSSEIKMFESKMNTLDEMVKNQIIKNSKEWLGKQKVTMELVENAFYSPVVKIPVDKDGNVLEYPNRIKVKLDRERKGDDFTGNFVSNKKYNTKVLAFDSSKTQLEFNESNFESVVPKNSQVVCLLELVYISISTKVSVKWKVSQLKVFRNMNIIDGYTFLDEDQPEELHDTNGNNHEVEDEVVEFTEEEICPNPDFEESPSSKPKKSKK